MCLSLSQVQEKIKSYHVLWRPFIHFDAPFHRQRLVVFNCAMIKGFQNFFMGPFKCQMPRETMCMKHLQWSEQNVKIIHWKFPTDGPTVNSKEFPPTICILIPWNIHYINFLIKFWSPMIICFNDFRNSNPLKKINGKQCSRSKWLPSILKVFFSSLLFTFLVV